MEATRDISRLFLGEEFLSLQGFESLVIGFTLDFGHEGQDPSSIIRFTLNTNGGRYFQGFSGPSLERVSTVLTRQTAAKLQGEEIIKQMQFEKTTGGDCSICHSRIRKNSRIPKLPCTHQFHQKCLFNWVKIRGNCPMCRADIKPKGEKL